MKNKIIALVFCSFFVFFAYGCQDKRAEVGKVLAEQDDETYHKAIGEMGELQKELETEKLYQDSLKEQIDQN